MYGYTTSKHARMPCGASKEDAATGYWCTQANMQDAKFGPPRPDSTSQTPKEALTFMLAYATSHAAFALPAVNLALTFLILPPRIAASARWVASL